MNCLGGSDLGAVCQMWSRLLCWGMGIGGSEVALIGDLGWVFCDNWIGLC